MILPFAVTNQVQDTLEMESKTSGARQIREKGQNFSTLLTAFLVHDEERSELLKELVPVETESGKNKKTSSHLEVVMIPTLLQHVSSFSVETKETETELATDILPSTNGALVSTPLQHYPLLRSKVEEKLMVELESSGEGIELAMDVGQSAESPELTASQDMSAIWVPETAQLTKVEEQKIISVLETQTPEVEGHLGQEELELEFTPILSEDDLEQGRGEEVGEGFPTNFSKQAQHRSGKANKFRRPEQATNIVQDTIETERAESVSHLELEASELEQSKTGSEVQEKTREPRVIEKAPVMEEMQIWPKDATQLEQQLKKETKAVEVAESLEEPEALSEKEKENGTVDKVEATGELGRKIQTSRFSVPKARESGPEVAFSENTETQARIGESSFELLETEVSGRPVLDMEDPKTIFPRLVENLQTLVQEERSEVRIQLKPDHLGELKIKLSLERGIMMAEFVVENETVREVIASQLPQLHTALQEQGAQVGKMMVNIGFSNQDQKQESPKPRHFGQTQQIRRAVSDETTKTPSYLGRTAWNQVDLKV